MNYRKDMIMDKNKSDKREPETASAVDALVIAQKWELPEDFRLYKFLKDGSYEYLEGAFFWGLVEVYNNKTDKVYNEIYLCGINEGGLYAHDLENDVDYDPGWDLKDIQFCMEYEQKVQMNANIDNKYSKRYER